MRYIYVTMVFVMLIVSAPGVRADDAAATQYPFFLAEGFGGLDFFMVKEALEAEGAMVCNPPDDEVPHFAGSEDRAAVIISQIEDCTELYEVDKVNLIGYSQGGLDARVVLAERPDLLASVTTVGSPHVGSSGISDRAIACSLKQELGLSCTADEEGAIGAFYALGTVATDPDAPAPDQMGMLAAHCQISSGLNPLALLACVTYGFPTSPGFDLKYPRGLPLFPCGNGPRWVFGPGFSRIYLFSWGGNQVFTDDTETDPSDAFLAGTSQYLQPDNDGLIERCSTHFGKVLRDDYPFNHLDLANQLGGLTGDTDPIDVYLEHASRLKNLGL